MRKATGYSTRGEANTFRPSRKTDHHRGSTSSEQASNAGIYSECCEVQETKEDHIVPRDSYTRRHHLRLFPQSIELGDVKRVQIDKITGLPTITTDQVIVWRSDKTLLRQGKPEQLENLKCTRITSHSKRRRYEPEEPAVIEVSTDNVLDDLDLNPPKPR